jgi:hypothetical protein
VQKKVLNKWKDIPFLWNGRPGKDDPPPLLVYGLKVFLIKFLAEFFIGIHNWITECMWKARGTRIGSQFGQRSRNLEESPYQFENILKVQ